MSFAASAEPVFPSAFLGVLCGEIFFTARESAQGRGGAQRKIKRSRNLVSSAQQSIHFFSSCENFRLLP
jgi:hypothetical protein